MKKIDGFKAVIPDPDPESRSSRKNASRSAPMPKSDFDDRVCFSSLFGFSALQTDLAEGQASNLQRAGGSGFSLSAFSLALDAVAAGSPFQLDALSLALFLPQKSL